MSKERWESVTKANRIEWTITHDKPSKTSKAAWYVIEPQYHAHTWTACAGIISPDQTHISTYGYSLEAAHAEALAKALKMARGWLTGKKPHGRKIIAAAERSAE